MTCYKGCESEVKRLFFIVGAPGGTGLPVQGANILMYTFFKNCVYCTYCILTVYCILYTVCILYCILYTVYNVILYTLFTLCI
jgi:hypothetical protein